MDEIDKTSHDIEFKRYLQIMRPYLEQLLDQDVIEICKAWIQRLSTCNENEKNFRNKYVFALCYQLAKGVLEEPFLKFPSSKELSPLTDDLDSDMSSTEVEYIVINSDEDDTKILFNNNKPSSSGTDYQSQNNELDCEENKTIIDNNGNKQNQDKENNQKQTVFCYNCPDMRYDPYKVSCEEYKYRANNLVLKLREIKTQNILLQKELDILKKEMEMKSGEGCTNNHSVMIDHCTSGCCHAEESNTTLNALKTKLREMQDTKDSFIETIEHLQGKINNYDEMKKHEIEEIVASHKMDILKTKTTTREETKDMYEKKITDLKQYYEMLIENIQSKANCERQEVITAKDRVISEKEQIISAKDNEIIRLKNLNDDQKSHLQGVINKFLERPGDDTKNDIIQQRAEQIEKRLNKAEKSKIKCARVYEAKLAHMQREKHLAECSLQLQLVRQKAQVVSDVAEENQAELNTALNKLESKYKEIVGNMQATAIQRRVQDQAAIDSILHAACGIRNENYTNCSQGTNRSQFSGKTMQNQNRNQMNMSYDSEMSALFNGNKVENLIPGNKSLGEDSMMAGYCLDGERMGELFERVYIPQRDIGDGPLNK